MIHGNSISLCRVGKLGVWQWWVVTESGEGVLRQRRSPYHSNNGSQWRVVMATEACDGSDEHSGEGAGTSMVVCL